MSTGNTGMIYYCRMSEQSGRSGHEIAVNMLKYGFREFFQTDFQEEAIQKHKFGKPYYAKNPDFKFNISHCKDGVAVVLSDREVGVDVESMRRVNGRTVKKCCSGEEMAYVFGDHEGRKEEMGILQDAETKRFLHVWTLKESYVKMTGEGLRVSFDQICFLSQSLQKAGGKGVKEIKGFDDACRCYLYTLQDLILALTVHWKNLESEPDFVWKELYFS